MSRQRLALFLLILLFSAAMQAAARPAPTGPAYTWTPGLDLSGTAGRSTYPALARVAGTETLWAVWTDNSTGQWEVLGRTRLHTTGAWSDTVNLSADPRADEGAAFYADGQGRLHLAWTRRNLTLPTTTELVYRQWSAGSWSPAVVLDSKPVNSPVYSLFFCEDISDTLWLFVNLGSSVSYTRLGPEGWGALSPQVFVEGMQGMGAIIAGSDGLFHVAALGKNQGNLGGIYDPYLDDAYYATTDGTTWSPLVNLGFTGTVAFDLGLVWDGTGALHLLWSDIHPLGSVDSVKSAVYERVLAGGNWAERVELTQPNEDQAVQDLAVVPDPAGQLHLAWSEGVLSGTGAIDLSIYYRRWVDPGWETEEVVFTSTQPSLNVDLVVDPLGEPAVAWEEGPSTAEEAYFSERQLVLPYRVYLPLVER